MDRFWNTCRWRGLRSLSAGGLLLAGCVATSTQPAPLLEMPPVRSEKSDVRPVAHTEAASAGPLTLERLLALAEQNQPDLASARAGAESARGKMIQAGLYPNPLVTLRSDEINNPNGPAGFPALTVSQEIVTAGKLKLAQAAAAHGVEAADWQAMTWYFNVRLRVRQAYYELLTAEREVGANKELLRIAEEALSAANKLVAGGAGTRPDILRAQVARNESEVRLSVSERRLEAAGHLLATAVGVPALPKAPDGTDKPLIVGTLDGKTPALDWEALREAMLSRSSEVQEARAVVMQSEGLLARAKAEVKPNIIAIVRPIYSDPDKRAELMVDIGAPMPIFNRNQGNIFAAQSDLARAIADVRSVELRLTDRLTLAFQRYRTARRQVQTLEERILPDASESLRLVRLGYERGDPKYDFTTVLQAQTALAQAQLTQVQARGELWRALSEISALLQHEALLTGE